MIKFIKYTVQSIDRNYLHCPECSYEWDPLELIAEELITVKDANGCTNTDSQLITVNANPVPTISGTLSI